MINYGLATKQHPGYGISHDNIAKKLTKKNWRDKAIVRDGNYLFVIECSYHGDRMYFIHGLPSEKSKNEYHEYLEDAIKYANDFSKIEGKYPEERNSSWRIFFRN
tara:strand:- start:311 stop:625 length:315 start_codon:yes stop_codon:yes gene_type:complete